MKPECIFCNVNFGSCCGCNPKCNFNEVNEKVKATGYQGHDIDDSHRRSHGLHAQIHKILKKRLQLDSKDITRLGVAYVNYQGLDVEEWEDGSENWLQIMVEIGENAFIMGSLDRSCEGDIKFPNYFLGSFWIGRTRYDISREVFF